jgi:hypothetical protein
MTLDAHGCQQAGQLAFTENAKVLKFEVARFDDEDR